MSMSALLRATLQTLRSTVPGLNPHNSSVTYDARPPASNAAPLYLCIYPTAWRPGPSEDIHEAIEDVYSISLGINMRTSVIAKDRWGAEAYLNQSRSIELAARELRVAMYRRRYDLLSLANQFLGFFEDGVQIVEPLLFDQSPFSPEPMGAEWFYAQPEGDIPNMPDLRHRDPGRLRALHQATAGAAEPLEHHGLLLEMSYTGGRRINPTDITQFRITVSLQVTADPSPAITGTYGGTPDSIQVTIDGQTYTPAMNAGIWSIMAGTVTLAVGTYDVSAEARYLGGEKIVNEESTNEITILDPDTLWSWTDGESHVWSDGEQAFWT